MKKKTSPMAERSDLKRREEDLVLVAGRLVFIEKQSYKVISPLAIKFRRWLKVTKERSSAYELMA